MKRPSFPVAFWSLLGIFNLIATWIGPMETAPIYAAFAIASFGMLAMRRSKERGLR